MLNIYDPWDYRKALKNTATEKGTTLRTVKVSFLVDEHSKYNVKAYGREHYNRKSFRDWNSDYRDSDDTSTDGKTWFTLRRPWVKLPNFISIWNDSHSACQLGSDPKLTVPPTDVEFSPFEKKVEEYFDKHNFTLGELASNDDVENYQEAVRDYKNNQFHGNLDYFLKSGGNFPFDMSGLICYKGYTEVTTSLMANFFNYLKDKDINVSACGGHDDDTPARRLYYNICFEDFDGPPAKAKELFEAYAEEFGLYRHLINLYFDENEPLEKAPVLLGTKITTINHTPSKSSASVVQQGNLLDQNGIAIEPGDVIAYPRGGDHNFYCLNYGIVKANTAKMIIMEDGQRSQHDKVMVIKSKNPKKKLPWDN